MSLKTHLGVDLSESKRPPLDFKPEARPKPYRPSLVEKGPGPEASSPFLAHHPSSSLPTLALNCAYVPDGSEKKSCGPLSSYPANRRATPNGRLIFFSSPSSAKFRARSQIPCVR